MIDIINVNFFIGQKQILHDINLHIEKGEFAVIVGPNGSGKSTLLNVITGTQKPSTGQVLIFGKSVLLPSDRARISYVPQKVTSFNYAFPINVMEAVMLGLVPKKGMLKRFSEDDYKMADEILNQLEIGHLKNRMLGRLSGGQQQRVFLARALISNPDILILDEPTVGIDSQSEEVLYKILGQKKSEGTTILMVTHDVYAVTNHADTIICMGEGSIYTSCRAKEFSPSKFESVYKYRIKKIEHKHLFLQKDKSDKI